MVNTLLVDNHDSFTYNLYSLLVDVNGVPPHVVANDISWEEIDFASFDNIVISPGPGTPERDNDFGLSARIISQACLPTLGVCLGHQGLCNAFGARIERAPKPFHGRRSRIEHTGRDLFEGIPSPFYAVRYHSLAVVDLPDDLEALAWSGDGVLMAVRHRHRPLWGVQFHPESILTECGREILTNFRTLSRASASPGAVGVNSPAPKPAAPTRLGRAAAIPYRLTHRRIPIDVDPEIVYTALFAGHPGSFWLDRHTSTDETSQFSIMGDCSGPLAERITYHQHTDQILIRRAGQGDETRQQSIFDYLKDELTQRRLPADSELPFDFALGYVGYLGYELKAQTGGVAVHISSHPDAAFLFSDRAIVIDHARGHCYLLCLQTADTDAASQWIAATATAVASLATTDPPVPAPQDQHAEVPVVLRHNNSRYRTLIAEAQELIDAGETYEVCLTNMASAQLAVDPHLVFSRLRKISQAPYATLLELDDLAVISASPERFLRVQLDGTVESRPIKGTRPRGHSTSHDTYLSADLLTSEKDRAENLMIVDLVRNDLTRACDPDSVYVPRLFEVESYPWVHQLVSTVRATLQSGIDLIDLVRCSFPPGSVTGAPKIRTMQILDHLEGAARGIYTGALGYLSLTGSADLAVAIRTIVAADDTVEFGIGGAVTTLSDPAAEFAETLTKGTALHLALRSDGVSASSGAAHHIGCATMHFAANDGRQLRAGRGTPAL